MTARCRLDRRPGWRRSSTGYVIAGEGDRDLALGHAGGHIAGAAGGRELCVEQDLVFDDPCRRKLANGLLGLSDRTRRHELARERLHHQRVSGW
jgi:hypothetical protein